jgi:hypothetical protein
MISQFVAIPMDLRVRGTAATRSPMWRLLPLLLGLALVELLVPWPDVAGLVLDDVTRVELREIPSGAPAPAAFRLFTDRE